MTVYALRAGMYVSGMPSVRLRAGWQAMRDTAEARSRSLPRCVVESFVADIDPAFVHTWRLRMPCGRVVVSHAYAPPVTVACSCWRSCSIQQPRRERQEHDF